MGMTPLEGLAMGTRSGDLDPGIILHLLRSGALGLLGSLSALPVAVTILLVYSLVTFAHVLDDFDVFDD